MTKDEIIDTGQTPLKDRTTFDTGPNLKKFVSTKQKFAAKLAKKNKPKPKVAPSATTLIDNDPAQRNATHGSAPNRPKINPEVRRPGWNRQSVGMTSPPVKLVFGADQPVPGPSRNIRMLKIGLGVLGGIALLLGSLASILYISKKRRKQKRAENKNRVKNRSLGGSPQGGPPPGPHSQYQTEYSQYPPSGWQNSLHPYGPMHNYNQLPYHGQIPNQAYYGVPYDAFHYPMAPGFYPHMAGFHEMNPAAYYPNCEGYVNGAQQYPESQGDISEVGFDPVLNYVETLGDELKTPKRKPKQRKDGSSTPHPIITRRASCKSLKSEISAWTEDEDTTSKAESTYISQENLSLKVSGSHSGKEETASKLDDESTKSSPQLSQTNDSAYGSRGSIQSPNSNPLIIPPFGGARTPPSEGNPVVNPVQNVPKISQYMVDPYNRPILAMTSLVAQCGKPKTPKTNQLEMISKLEMTSRNSSPVCASPVCASPACASPVSFAVKNQPVKNQPQEAS